MKLQLARFAANHEVTIDFFEEVVSTNDLAHAHRYTHGDVIIAECQSKGRGQRGNSWESLKGQNLTCSIVLKPDFLPAEKQFLLSEAVALAIVDMLGSYNITAQVKWTNDIYVDGRKIAGILIENDVCGMNLARSIIGIGLNINQIEFSRSLPNPTSMAMINGQNHAPEEVFERLYTSIMEHFTSLKQGYTDQIECHYHRSLYLRGQRHKYLTPTGCEFYAAIQRVEPTGELIMLHDDGTTHSYLFKEVEFTL